MPIAPTLILALTLAASASCGSPPAGAGRVPRLPLQVAVASAGPGLATRTAPAADLQAVRRVARRYYAALDGLRLRMRIAPLAAVMAPNCPCRAQIQAVEAAVRRGERYTDRVRLLTLVPHLDRPDLADVVVSVDVTRAGIVDARGRRIGRVTTAHGVHRELMLRRIAGRWLIERVVAV